MHNSTFNTGDVSDEQNVRIFKAKKNNNCSLSFLENKISTALGTGSNKKYILYTY